jgi:hypothetical protein
MLLHANAKLGLAGRVALVAVVEEGLSLRAAAAAFSVSPARRTGGGIAGSMAAASRVRCLIARPVRTARRGFLQPSCRSGSVTAVVRPAGVRGWSRVRPASRIRPCGRSSSGPGSRVGLLR